MRIFVFLWPTYLIAIRAINQTNIENKLCRSKKRERKSKNIKKNKQTNNQKQKEKVILEATWSNGTDTEENSLMPISEGFSNSTKRILPKKKKNQQIQVHWRNKETTMLKSNHDLLGLKNTKTIKREEELKLYPRNVRL